MNTYENLSLLVNSNRIRMFRQDLKQMEDYKPYTDQLHVIPFSLNGKYSKSFLSFLSITKICTIF